MCQVKMSLVSPWFSVAAHEASCPLQIAEFAKDALMSKEALRVQLAILARSEEGEKLRGQMIDFLQRVEALWRTVK